jgi:hypothetical protein
MTPARARTARDHLQTAARVARHTPGLLDALVQAVAAELPAHVDDLGAARLREVLARELDRLAGEGDG